MYRKKIKVIVDDKEYIIKEPTVADYVLLMEDQEQFFEKMFYEYKTKPNITLEQVVKLFDELFSLENSFENLLNKLEKQEQEVPDFHILLAKLVKYFGNSFDDFMKMNFSFFIKILNDFEQIESEKQNKKTTNNKVISSAQELKKLL